MFDATTHFLTKIIATLDSFNHDEGLALVPSDISGKTGFRRFKEI